MSGAQVEYGVFRKNGGWAPLGNCLFKDRVSVVKFMAAHYEAHEWLEVRSREVTAWVQEAGE